MNSLGPPQSPGASVVMVTYHSMATLHQCLESLLPTLSLNDELIVVDNASIDGTTEYLKDIESPSIRRLYSDINLGFSKASNEGLKISKGETLVLLNPDTIVRPGWIEGLRSLARRKTPDVCPRQQGRRFREMS